MSFSSTAIAVAALGEFSAMDDGTLVSAQRLLAAHARETAVLQAQCAAMVAVRSDPSLGLSGLARRNGFVNAESFVQAETGSTKVEATKLVRVGELIDASGWQGTLGAALASGNVSVDAANAIRVGLGGASAPDSLLLDATQKLVDQAGSVDADELARRARSAREELDTASIARDEQARREQRYFSARRHDSGVVKGSFALSDEDGALILAIYDQATSPRNRGPRCVDTAEVAGSEHGLPNDPRTNGQKAADIFAGLLRIGADTDANAVLGLNRPAVRIHVAAETIAARSGHGFIEDSNDYPIAFATVERHLCTTGVIGVAFNDNGQALNVGRDQRLFTTRQRIALAARDGGCRFPGCDRPISWTEAHHVDYWQRDSGETNIADGILLCRSHHVLIHDNSWVIRRDDGQYWLTAPPGLDRGRTPREMPSKQPLVRALQRA